jgi:hypothetical protein
MKDVFPTGTHCSSHDHCHAGNLGLSNVAWPLSYSEAYVSSTAKLTPTSGSDSSTNFVIGFGGCERWQKNY